METENGHGSKIVVIIIILAILLFLTIRFGVIGLRTGVGIIALYVAPIYFILKFFELDDIERVILSIFLGIGIISTIVYFAGLIVSFRIGILFAFIVCILIGVILHYAKKSSPKEVKL